MENYGKTMGKPQDDSCGKPQEKVRINMGKLWDYYGKPWENHGITMENHGITMGSLWDNYTKTKGKPWDNHGKPQENYGKGMG